MAELKTESVRKSIHVLIALCPALAALNLPLTVLALASGIVCYSLMERLRLAGVQVPLISAITCMASRQRDASRFVRGPVTLALGAIAALLLLPLPAASIGIYALAFGDSFASLAGKLFGRHRPAFLCGKSLEGSAACFAAAFIPAWLVSHSLAVSLAAALAATAAEALPLKDYDNIALPLAAGLAALLLM